MATRLASHGLIEWRENAPNGGSEIRNRCLKTCERMAELGHFLKIFLRTLGPIRRGPSLSQWCRGVYMDSAVLLETLAVWSGGAVKHPHPPWVLRKAQYAKRPHTGWQ